MNDLCERFLQDYASKSRKKGFLVLASGLKESLKVKSQNLASYRLNFFRKVILGLNLEFSKRHSSENSTEKWIEVKNIENLQIFLIESQNQCVI